MKNSNNRQALQNYTKFVIKVIQQNIINIIPQIMDLSSTKYSLGQHQQFKIEVQVSNPTQVKTTLSSYTVYQIKGVDKKGQFQCSRRYSEFDLVRQYLLKRWPGCFVPGLPEKKMVGNSEANFVQNRKHGLQMFCLQLSCLPHLWYSQEVDIFLRKSGDFQANLKALPTQNHEDIIKKYDERFPNLRGKSIDTNLLSKVLEFSKFLKRAQPLLATNKQFLVFFTQIKNNNNDQYSILYNYLLPEYEKTCLANYLDQNTSGKMIFSDEQDERLASYVNKIKQVIAKRNFQQLLMQIEHEERQINAFLEVYKQHAFYDKKIGQLKDREKQLQLQQAKLNMGKQGLFKSIFKSNIQQNKKDVEREININKDFITTYSLLSDLITMLLGFFEIDRFRQAKIEAHAKTIRQVAALQLQLAKIRKQICTHILDNHNLILID